MKMSPCCEKGKRRGTRLNPQACLEARGKFKNIDFHSEADFASYCTTNLCRLRSLLQNRQAKILKEQGTLIWQVDVITSVRIF